MKKLLTSVSIASLLLPSLAFAAYNDVSLTTDTVLTINGITVNVSGSTASVESIVVNPTTFVTTLQANSSFQVTAPNLNVLSTDQKDGISIDACNGTASKLGYTASSSQIIVTITPSATLCSTAAADTSGGVGSSGGGGGATTSVTPVTPMAPLTPEAKAAAIAAIKTQLISLIQQLIVLLNQQLQTMKASGSY